MSEILLRTHIGIGFLREATSIRLTHESQPQNPIQDHVNASQIILNAISIGLKDTSRHQNRIYVPLNTTCNHQNPF